MKKQFITNQQVLELSALLKYQATKEFNLCDVLHKGTVVSTSIGLGSIAIGLISTATKIPEISQTSLCVGLYGTLGGMGLSGVCERRQIEAIEKNEISDHIINAIIYGADFSQCNNMFEVLNIVSDCYLRTQSLQNNQAEATRIFDYFYKYPTAHNICGIVLNRDYTPKDQLHIAQTLTEIYSYICHQQAILPSSQLEEISSQININNNSNNYIINDLNNNENCCTFCDNANSNLQSTHIPQANNIPCQNTQIFSTENTTKIQEDFCLDQNLTSTQPQQPEQ